MKNMNDIEEIIKLALYSPYIEGYKPVSIILLANIEEGKTTLVEKFRGTKNTLYIDNVTAYGFMEILKEQTKNKNELNHIIIPDLTTILSKQEATVSSFLCMLNSMSEEGITKIRSYAMNFEPEGDEPFKCGVISCLAKSYLDYKKRINFMKRIGLLSRLIPVSYSHKQETAILIKDSMRKEIVEQENAIKLNLPDKKIDVKGNSDIFLKLSPLINKLAFIEGTHGYRAQKNLQCLMKASALMDGRNEVNDDDLKRITRLGTYFGTDYQGV